MELKPFWMVWCERAGAPTVKHESYAAAKAEAERLARRNEGQSFHVLEVVGSATVNRVEWVERSTRHGDGCACNTCIPF
jgi:hypothetical protein